MKNERAKIFATVFQQVAGDPDTLQIYIDGLVMAHGGKSARHLRIRDVRWPFVLNGKPMTDESPGEQLFRCNINGRHDRHGPVDCVDRGTCKCSSSRITTRQPLVRSCSPPTRQGCRCRTNQLGILTSRSLLMAVHEEFQES